MPANEMRRYMMTSDFRQYIAEYTVANFWRYPIRRHVTYASALEWIFHENWAKILTFYHSLGKYSRRQIDNIFLTFPRKQPTVDNLHEISNPVSWENKKKYFEMLSAKD